MNEDLFFRNLNSRRGCVNFIIFFYNILLGHQCIIIVSLCVVSIHYGLSIIYRMYSKSCLSETGSFLMQANLKRKVFLSGCRRFVTVYDAIIGSGKGSSFHLIRTRATSCITLKSQINITKFGFGVEMVSVILLRATAS